MKKLIIEVKWAFIYIAMTFIWALIGKLLGFHGRAVEYNVYFNSLLIIPSIVIYILALKEKKRVYFKNNMNLKQGFLSGLILTLFITILGPLTPVFTNIISPDFFHNLNNYAVTHNIMNEVEASREYNLISFIIQGLIAAPSFGILYTLIIAAVLSRKKVVI